jgi:hypothetical protein
VSFASTSTLLFVGVSVARYWSIITDLVPLPWAGNRSVAAFQRSATCLIIPFSKERDDMSGGAIEKGFRSTVRPTCPLEQGLRAPLHCKKTRPLIFEFGLLKLIYRVSETNDRSLVSKRSMPIRPDSLHSEDSPGVVPNEPDFAMSKFARCIVFHPFYPWMKEASLGITCAQIFLGKQKMGSVTSLCARFWFGQHVCLSRIVPSSLSNYHVSTYPRLGEQCVRRCVK